MEYIIRKMKNDEYLLLEDFLYEAIYNPDEANLIPKSIINEPELKVYIEKFGDKKDDYCLCAEVSQKVVGAVWVRNIKGYGNVDSNTLEIAMSLYKEFRGRGIGSKMIKEMLNYLRVNEYSKVSLSVQKENYATKMYLKEGFEIIHESEEEYIMVCYL